MKPPAIPNRTKADDGGPPPIRSAKTNINKWGIWLCIPLILLTLIIFANFFANKVQQDGEKTREARSDAGSPLHSNVKAAAAYRALPEKSRKPKSLAESTNKQSTPASSNSQPIVFIGNVTGQAEFFGIRNGSSKVAYVIDNSSSMSDGQFDRARDELILSIEALSENHEFAVFLYNSELSTFKSGELVAASDQHKTEFLSWMSTFKTDGGTLPVPGISAAIDSGSNSIFLLSDGEFQDEEVKKIIKLCQMFKVRVNVISIMHNSSSLKRIATECHGEFAVIK